MARLTTIRLYGALGARFGRVHKLAVQTSAEAVKALCVNLDGLEDYLMSAKKNGMTFAVFRGKRNIGVDDFKGLGGDSDIRIAPVMEGSKKAGVFQTILGAVMVVVGVVVGVMTGWMVRNLERCFKNAMTINSVICAPVVVSFRMTFVSKMPLLSAF